MMGRVVKSGLSNKYYRPSFSNYTFITTTGTISPSGVQTAMITRGQTLTQGQGFKSLDGGHIFVMQANGEVAVFNTSNGNKTWNSGTAGKGTPPYTFSFQASDSNLVIYDSTNTALWSSNTAGQAMCSVSIFGSTMICAYLAMQNDGNLVLYN